MEAFLTLPVVHMTITTLRNRIFSVAIILLLATTYLIYQPGLPGNFFVLDDTANLNPLNTHGGITSARNAMAFITSGDTGPTGRPISLASFLIDDQYWPGDPGRYRYNNLLLHLLVGVVLYTFLRQLLRLTIMEKRPREIVALLTTALFLLHPLNTTTVLYIVQRMTILSVLFVLTGLSLHLYLRQHFRTTDYYHWRHLFALGANLTLFTTLATFSKENGILILPLVLALELIFADRLPAIRIRPLESTKGRGWRNGAVIAGLSVAVLALWFVWERFTAGYQNRPFTLSERLLTEATILFDYLHKILFPKIVGLSLFHDDIPVHGTLDIPVTLSLMALFFLFLVAVRARRKAPLLSFAILWFFIGHSIESTIFPLELYFEHRNYLPMMGPLLALIYYCFRAAGTLPFPSVRRLFYAIPLLYLVTITPLTHQTARAWSAESLLYSKWAMEHPNSLRANLLFAHYLYDNGAHERAHRHYEEIASQFPEAITAQIHLINAACQQGVASGQQIKDLISQLDSGHYFLNIEILGATRKLTSTILSRQCPQISADQLLALVKRFQQTNYTATSMKFASHIYDIEAEIHIAQGDLQRTMDALDKVFINQPTVDIPLKQAIILASAQLYDDALDKIGIAETVDKQRRLLSPSRAPELKALKRQIEQVMLHEASTRAKQ